MKRENLINRIIPTTIGNTDNSLKNGNEKFNTTDLIYIDSYDEKDNIKEKNKEREISATDYTIMNNAAIRYQDNNPTAYIYLRSASYKDGKNVVDAIKNDGTKTSVSIDGDLISICPSFRYNLPTNISNIKKRRVLPFLKGKQQESFEKLEVDIKEVKDEKGKELYHTLQIGEYPQTKVDEKLAGTLELLYNEGKIKEGISATGRWYSCNGNGKKYKEYAGKHSPEFEYEGNRYVRVISYPSCKDDYYSDGTITEKSGIVRWVKVEPISFVIKNWKEMPKSINPKGSGKAKYFDLTAEEAIISNIPFYPYENDENSQMWQNSSVRGFLNGIDVRNIKENGLVEYGAERGGNYTGECNFLNEAFNLSRQPIIEYTIPESEIEIPDDAFNGCITLKKLIMHSGIKAIGKNAFKGLEFKYAYKTEKGELVFSQELPKNKEEYKEVIDINEIAKTFDDFDYNILVQNKKLDVMANFSEILKKNKFSIPCVYALELIKNKKEEAFYENSDFRFFKNELPNINDTLLDFTEEERLDFFKFATALGCFSTEKILDKRGKETEVILAQKATSLLVKILKTDEMKLR